MNMHEPCARAPTRITYPFHMALLDRNPRTDQSLRYTPAYGTTLPLWTTAKSVRERCYIPRVPAGTADRETDPIEPSWMPQYRGP